MPVFMPWPQSGRMQYEKIKSKSKGRIFQQHVCSGKRTLISSFAVGVSRKCSKFGNCRIFWIALSSSRLTASAPRPEGADVRPRDEPSDGADGGSFGESSSSRTYCSLQSAFYRLMLSLCRYVYVPLQYMLSLYGCGREWDMAVSHVCSPYHLRLDQTPTEFASKQTPDAHGRPESGRDQRFTRLTAAPSAQSRTFFSVAQKKKKKENLCERTVPDQRCLIRP
jgi:hypothetical protein